MSEHQQRRKAAVDAIDAAFDQFLTDSNFPRDRENAKTAINLMRTAFGAGAVFGVDYATAGIAAKAAVEEASEPSRIITLN